MSTVVEGNTYFEESFVPDRAGSTQRWAITGLGGLGKTQTAV